jgi:hypothetical protein
MKPKAKDQVLYWDDNGRIICGACAGNSLRYTLRTLSGHRAKPVTKAESDEFQKMADKPYSCESCGKIHPSDRRVIIEEMSDPTGTYYVLRVVGLSHICNDATGKAEMFSSASNARGFAIHHGWQVVVVKWVDKYKVGDIVETRVYYAEGARWCRARILRKMQTGKLVVQLVQNPAVVLTVTRAQDIRQVS